MVGISHFFLQYSFFYENYASEFPFSLRICLRKWIFEIIFGLGIMVKFLRRYAAWGLILLLIAVYPANIYLAFSPVAQNEIGITSFVASWVRLPIQFVLIGLAYMVSKIKN